MHGSDRQSITTLIPQLKVSDKISNTRSFAEFPRVSNAPHHGHSNNMKQQIRSLFKPTNTPTMLFLDVIGGHFQTYRIRIELLSSQNMLKRRCDGQMLESLFPQGIPFQTALLCRIIHEVAAWTCS